MAEVDPDDDSVTRYVVWHYRYDPTHHQRRYVTVAAYDNQVEFESRAQEWSRALLARKAAGDADPSEDLGGEVRTPGHRLRAQNERLLDRAWSHGVWPPHWDPENPPEGIHLGFAVEPQNEDQD